MDDHIDRDSRRESVVVGKLGRFQIVPTVNRRGCVDPRQGLEKKDPIPPGSVLVELFTREHTNVEFIPYLIGAERSPGGSLGIAMALIAAKPDLTEEDAITLVAGYEETEGRIFFMHGDDHPGENKVGCGHADRASIVTNEALYGLPAERVKKLVAAAVKLAKENKLKAEISFLAGGHAEKGVLVVNSLTRTLDAVTADVQCFRFDALRHDQSMQRLAIYLQSKSVDVNGDTLLAEAKKQREATLSLLAKGLPVYQVDVDGASHSRVTKLS